MSRRRYSLSCVLALTLYPATAAAQVIETLVLEGDSVAGVGLVTYVDNLAINDDGSWLVEADTDNANTDEDSVVLKDGVLYLREGQSLLLPTGALLDSFDSIYLNDGLNASFNFFLDGTSGINDDSGLYWNTSLLIQESDISTAPQFSAGTPYIGFFEVRINVLDQLLTVASVDDPAINSTVDRALVRLDTDGAGNLLGETVVKKEGDLAGSGNHPISDFGTDPTHFDFNDAGQVMYLAKLTSGSADDWAIYIDNTLITEEGAAAPVAGRAWSNLSSAEMSMNNLGDYAFHGQMDGDTASNYLICRNGAKFVQEGDSHPAIAPYLFTSFGSGPVDIGNNGRVLWYGDWDDADTSRDNGLFLDDDLLVQEGVTMIGGKLVITLQGYKDSYRLSDSGEWIIFEAELEGDLWGAFRIQVPDPYTTYCYGDGSGTACPCGNENDGSVPGSGCANGVYASGARMVASGSARLSADTLQLSCRGMEPNNSGLYFQANNDLSPGTLWGAGLRCAGGSLKRLGVRFSDATGASDTSGYPHTISAKAGNIAPGDTRYYQCWYRNPQNSPCASEFNTSNGVAVTWLP